MTLKVLAFLARTLIAAPPMIACIAVVSRGLMKTGL